MSDLLPYYKETLAKELVQKGIKNFKLSDNGDNSSEEVNFIIYSPVIKNRVKLIRDFSKFKNLKAVLSLYAGIEDFIGNKTLKCPLIKMIDKTGLTNSMVEWCLAHTLRLHLGLDRHILGQDGIWRHKIKPPIARDRSIGVLGLGELGRPVSLFLKKLDLRFLVGVELEKILKELDAYKGLTDLKKFSKIQKS